MYTRRQWLVKWELAFLACREGGMYAGNAILVYWPNIWWDKSSGGSLGHCSLRVKANHRHARKVQHHSNAYLHWFLDSISSISAFGDRFFFWNPVQSFWLHRPIWLELPYFVYTPDCPDYRAFDVVPPVRKNFPSSPPPPPFISSFFSTFFSSSFAFFLLKMAIVLPTGQWYAPSAVINDVWY